MVSIAEIPSVGGASKKDCGTCDPNAQCGNGLEKVYPTCAVQFGAMRFIGEFRYAPGMMFGCGQKVVIATERGTEVGEQKSLTCSGCDKSISRDQIKTYAKNSGREFFQLHAGKIMRIATPADLAEDQKQQQSATDMLRESRELVRRHDLPMKMVLCEYVFGGERAVFYFMSETRVDFRELVRELAGMYHTRIELRQIGARDEARLVADYEICGRECCCKNFLKTLRPIKMEMAKLQKATLDPSKVSGRCGRLRCCLRYEHESYTELNQKLPKVGRRVMTESGPGVVVDRQILTQLLIISLDDNRRVAVAIEDLVEGDPGATPATSDPRGDRRPDADSGERRRGRRGGRKQGRRDEGSGGGRSRRSEDGKSKDDSAVSPTIDDSGAFEAGSGPVPTGESEQGGQGGQDGESGVPRDGKPKRKRRPRRRGGRRNDGGKQGGESDSGGPGATE
jgi:cell fate regulator YaaT (PSP1 superfamily)